MLESYQSLNDWYRERHSKRTSTEGESTKKRISVNTLKINDPEETHDSEEDLKEKGYKIGLLGNVCVSQKEQTRHKGS